MEEEKAAAYYDELTRKGEAAARFKQGLGFSSSSRNEDVPTRGSALPSSSSLSGFVRASSPSTCHKQAQLESIQNKLKQKRTQSPPPRVRERDRDRERDKDRDRNRDRDREHKKRHRSSSRERDKHRDRYRDRDRDVERQYRRSSSRDRERRSRRRSRSRSLSPEKRKLGKRGEGKRERNGGVDYAKLIDGYDKMSPAERVKAKMKFQLAETVEKDAKNGMGSGWERFEFDKDAPLDDEEMEVADDDAALVKHLGQSFRFSIVESKREDQIKAAHDEAIFGSSRVLPSIHTEHMLEQESESESKNKESAPATSLLSEKVRIVA